VPLDTIEVVLGDTSLPDGPISGGSMVTGSLVPAVYAAADQAIESLMQVATTAPGSPFESRKSDELALEGGRRFVKANGTAKAVSFTEVLSRANVQHVTGSGKGEATFGNPTPKISTRSFGCHFVEATRQPEIACLRVGRVVTVIDAGRIVNPLAARNQVGRHRHGHRHGPARAHALRPAVRRTDQQQPRRLHGLRERRPPPIDVHFLDHPDKEINEVGARGIGEIGLAGFAAAVTAAVHHATGVRVRESPVKIEDLIA
jgi:xanthine dehydrogenase YagR molybdenum-binding subunit